MSAEVTGGAGVTSSAEVTSLAELDELIGVPMPWIAEKARDRLDAIDKEWIAHSPFCLVATSAADGTCDVSPKGDPAGFVRVLDDHTLAIPERPGNRRIDGYRNMVTNPHIGILFLVPGRTDTLRVNGRVRVLRDAPYFDDMVVKGHRPLLAAEVTVEEIFYHCAKSFLRSHLWKPEEWRPDALPSRAKIVQALERTSDPLEEVQAYYESPSYNDGLYKQNL
ncbi:pyridoxamine 5'-phosphate oxidase family protein [Pseudonocardia broussonetiae]|nr:pyridoxamine 5'-phosphate oxidase family protein [Pseudonocardia broussonetiae]